MDELTLRLFGQKSWLAYLILPAVSITVGLFVSWLFFALLKYSSKRKSSVLKEQLLLRLKSPVYLLMPLLLLYPLLSYFGLGVFFQKTFEAILILSFAWLLISVLRALEEVIKEKFEVKEENKAEDRKVLTQLRFIKSVAIVVIITLAVASILWNIPAARKLGETILTSAGVLGIIVGVAAQKSIANLVMGFQLAFTQPFKIDDAVVIEDEFGIIEDVTLTYVVVKTWDWRRLVLPLTYFNDKPFTNWSFNSKDIINTVFFYVDYSFPVAELRNRFKEVLTAHQLWDKRVADLLVTDVDNRTMQLRATFSTKNATAGWNLRCAIREELIYFIQENYPHTLPKLRTVDNRNMV